MIYESRPGFAHKGKMIGLGVLIVGAAIGIPKVLDHRRTSELAERVEQYAMSTDRISSQWSPGEMSNVADYLMFKASHIDTSKYDALDIKKGWTFLLNPRIVVDGIYDGQTERIGKIKMDVAQEYVNDQVEKEEREQERAILRYLNSDD